MDHTIGLAGVPAAEFPTGSKDFSSETYSSVVGIHCSYRRGLLAIELNSEAKFGLLGIRLMF